MSYPPALTAFRTQSTARILEFRCLYTQDLRRKQKRWQDGRLKFHTFNKRIMVYDERSNYVGDTHWREDSRFNEGDELELERGGILVEIGEYIGERDQDLWELVDKRIKEREERAAAKVSAASPPTHQSLLARAHMSASARAPYLRSKPLNAVIGTPTGHYGRAMVSNLSPFEQKNSRNPDENREGRPAKRQKQHDIHSKNGYAQNLTGATLSLGSAGLANTQTAQSESSRASVLRGKSATIDLTHDQDSYGMRQGSTGDETCPTRSPSKTQKQKAVKYSLSRSRHGNLLMGSRPLSGQGTYVSIQAAKIQDISINKSAQPNSNVPTYQNTFTGPNLPQDITKSKPTEKVKVPVAGLKPQPSLSPVSELPMLSSIRSPAAGNINKSSEDSLAVRLMAEQPVTALRIKPRPPRKMMMLMELSSERRSALCESDAMKALKPIGNVPSIIDNVITSRTTDQLDSFCQKQGELLEARLNGKRPKLDPSELSLPPIDNGIDYHIIDSALSQGGAIPHKVKSVYAPAAQRANIPQEPAAISKVRSVDKVRSGIGDIEEELGLPRSGSFTPQNVDTAAIEMAINPLAVINTGREAAAFGSANDLGQRGLAAEPAIITTPKMRLVNPATERTSFKATTDKTVNREAPAFHELQGIALPLPRISARTMTATTKGHIGVGGPARETKLHGPWSRESYDLFGAWRPPGRGPQTNAPVAIN